MNTQVNNRQSPIVVDDPPPLFHGTDVELEVGDLILPGRECGKSGGHYVWMDNERGALMWGSCKAGRRAYVYEVEPIGPVETCRSSFRARRARVIRIVGAWW